MAEGRLADALFKPPIVTRAGAPPIGSRAPARYFFGSAWNLATQLFEQK